MNITAIGKRLIKNQVALLLDQPFFGSSLYRLRIEPDETCETMWTDGDRLGWSPSFVDSCIDRELQAVLCHEVVHCILLHHTRRGNRNNEQWNVACDYAVNIILHDANMTLPKGVLFDEQYRGMSAEEIYSRLFGQDSKKDEGKKGSQKEIGQTDPGRCGEVRDSAKSNVEERGNWQVIVAQAMQQAKNAGKLSGSLEHVAKEIIEPKADWRMLLDDYIDRSAKNDHDWLVPSRRYLSQGVYLPSLRSEELNVVILVDVSGSISESTVNQFISEINAILSVCQNAVVHCVFVDTKVQAAFEVDRYAEPDYKFKKGGGTDFRPGFKWIEDNMIDPNCVVYLTDLCCSRYPSEPEYPVLWVSTRKDRKPKFGELIEIDI